MRATLIIFLLMLGGVTVEVMAEKAGGSPAPHKTDLGVMKTPWGSLHSFDRLPAVKRVPPEYPLVERRRGITGGVVLAVLVSEDGLVADVQVLKSSGNRNIEAAAMKAVRQWRYRPLDPRERFVTIQPITFDIRED